MTRKICIVTGTRAEYGGLRWVMDGVRAYAGLVLQILVTGMHLSPEFGLTFQEIEDDGFSIDEKVEMLLSADTSTGIARSVGLGVMGIADALNRLKPDIVVLLGDRYELLAAATAAMILRIPIAHLHGGEVTEGAFDDCIRHAITKMSHLHFVAAEDYRRRVIQMGEDPERVYLVGGLGVDAIKRADLLDRKALEAELGLQLGQKSLLVTHHPVTRGDVDSVAEQRELLAALATLDDVTLIFTMPNADTGGRELADDIKQFVATHPRAKSFVSLGQQRYLSCLKHVDGVVGNSSSGLCEAPTFNIGTINIGARQDGRLKAQSVIDCVPERDAIIAAIQKLYSADFQRMLHAGVTNPYGDGGASEKIVNVLANVPLEKLLHKSFRDQF
jgi:GDP/UDP-N,N'-diacetylbacillosamine 2-epimerase (hydrolysing)